MIRLQLKSVVIVRDGARVNEKAPRSYRPHSPREKRPVSQRVRVVFPSGRLAYTVTDEVGRMLHRERIGDGVFTRKGRLVCVRLLSGPDRLKDGTRYVTNSESDTNISNVFAFIPILDIPREVFAAVQKDCLAEDVFDPELA